MMSEIIHRFNQCMTLFYIFWKKTFSQIEKKEVIRIGTDANWMEFTIWNEIRKGKWEATFTFLRGSGYFKYGIISYEQTKISALEYVMTISEYLDMLDYIKVINSGKTHFGNFDVLYRTEVNETSQLG